MPLMAMDPFEGVTTTQPGARTATVAYPTIAPMTTSASPTTNVPLAQPGGNTTPVSPVQQPTQGNTATPGVMDPLAFAPGAPPNDVMTGAVPQQTPSPLGLAPNWYAAPAAQQPTQPQPMALDQALNLMRR